MNKSKFLKKSLAMLLALMLVFAMIPLSASAAPAPTVSKIEVNGVKVDLETLSAEITDPAGGDVNVTVQLLDKKGSVAYYTGLNDKNDADETTTGVWAFTLEEEDVAEGKFTFVTVDEAGAQNGEYTVTFTTTPRDGDTSVKSVELVPTDKGEMYDVWSDDNGATIDYTVVAPYGYDIAKGAVVVTPTADTSEVYEGTTAAIGNKINVTSYYSKVPFRVVAENGSEENYTVTIVEPIPFASFSIEDERREAQISRVTEDPDFVTASDDPQVNGEPAPQIEVYVPYGAKADAKGNFYFTPEFTTNYEDLHIYMYKRATTTDKRGGEKVELISGETYNLKDFDPLTPDEDIADAKRVYMTVEYSDGSVENWQLLFHQFTSDSVAAIKGLRVDNYPATIDETTTPPTITLTIPASVRKDGEMEVNVSNYMKILAVNTDLPEFTASKDGFQDWAWFPTLDLTKDEYTLRVTAPEIEIGAEEKQVKDYKLVVETAEVAEPKLNSIQLKSEKVGLELEGEIDGHTITFNEIPYRYKEVADPDNTSDDLTLADDEWQLFWNATSGAKVTYKKGTTETPIDVSGAIVADKDYLPNPSYNAGKRFRNDAADATIDVTIENKTVSYTIVFNSADANDESTLGDLWIAHNDVQKLDDMNNGNSMKAVVDNAKGTITADIYYNEWTLYNDNITTDDRDTGLGYGGATFKTTLPDGAKIYFVNTHGVSEVEDGKLQAINPLDEEAPADADARTVTLPGVGLQDIYNYGIVWNKDAGKADKTDYDGPLYIVVVSEAANENIVLGPNGVSSTTLDSIKTDKEFSGQATVYELTLTQKEPRSNTDLKSVSVYDAYTGTTVEAKIEKATTGDIVNLTLPAYMVDEHRKSIDNLYLNFGPFDGGQTVKAVDLTDEGTNKEAEKVGDEVHWLRTDDEGNYALTKTAPATKLTWIENAGLAVVNDWDNPTTGAFDLDRLQVEAENGKGRTVTYKLNVTIADANTKAVLNSVSYNGSTASPNADREVALSVPFNTEVTSMALEFNVSENAYVLEGKWTVADLADLTKNDEDAKAPIVDEDETFNFLQTRTFTVVSEDNKETETYEITVVPAETFNDVTPDQWYYDEVMTAANKGWINGMRPGYFEPNGTMTRGQFATIIARILNYNPDNYPNTAFPDVPSDIYYSEAVAFCKENNIIDGDDKGNFNGEDPITREQMAKILCQALQLKVTVPEDKFDDDAKIAEWAKGYVYACQEAGIMEGDNGSFRPTDNATRAEGAAVLVRAFA